jgi:hypothetical protein
MGNEDREQVRGPLPSVSPPSVDARVVPDSVVTRSRNVGDAVFPSSNYATLMKVALQSSSNYAKIMSDALQPSSNYAKFMKEALQPSSNTAMLMKVALQSSSNNAKIMSDALQTSSNYAKMFEEAIRPSDLLSRLLADETSARSDFESTVRMPGFEDAQEQVAADERVAEAVVSALALCATPNVDPESHGDETVWEITDQDRLISLCFVLALLLSIETWLFISNREVFDYVNATAGSLWLVAKALGGQVKSSE